MTLCSYALMAQIGSMLTTVEWEICTIGVVTCSSIVSILQSNFEKVCYIKVQKSMESCVDLELTSYYFLDALTHQAGQRAAGCCCLQGSKEKEKASEIWRTSQCTGLHRRDDSTWGTVPNFK